jgi:hypothetical protein
MHSNNFRELINLLFHSKKIQHQFNYEKNFYKRHAFINKAISQYKNCKYLEIGVAYNDVFNSIPLKMENKFGVDPQRGGNFRMTSDEFFKTYNNLKFDVIFIDGMHEYKQCQKDLINSMQSLNSNGIIFCHDFLPRSFFEEHWPPKQNQCSGNIWKLAVELMNSKNVDFKICNIDSGICILKLKKNFEYLKIPALENNNYADFLKSYYPLLPLINSEQALDYIEMDK